MKSLLRIDIGSKRIFGLDILRALAILFVVSGHGQDLLPQGFDFLNRIRFDGVSIFFVLSGFLIGGILIKIVEHQQANTKTLFDFWKRRWFRTLPNYFLILTVLLSYYSIKRPHFDIFEYKEFFIFSQNLFYPHASFFPEAWSLSVEEWFYLLIPCIIFLLISIFHLKPKRSVLLTASSIILLITLFRFYRFSTIEIESIGEWDLIFRKQVITRLDSLMYGVVGAYLQYYYTERWNKFRIPLFISGIGIFLSQKFLLSIGTVGIDSFYQCVLSFSSTSLATLFLLPYLNDLKSGSGVIYKTITTISLISYSMYLLNLSVVRLIIIRHLSLSSLFASPYLIALSEYILYWTFTVFGSILLYKYYEIPLTALRDKNWNPFNNTINNA